MKIGFLLAYNFSIQALIVKNTCLWKFETSPC